MLNEILHFTVLSLVGSLALVFISKVILNKLLRRNVNYYEGTEINGTYSACWIRCVLFGKED